MMLNILLLSGLCCSLTWNWSSATQVLRPRGVSLQKKIFYDPGKDFSCLDGSLSIPFVFVNDDYCDCPDGTDEPGTPACPNGLFHCSNLGYTPWDLPSSRVNDGICDCCDGSDEYNSTVNCVDNCSELGREAMEAARRLEEVYNSGSKIRQDLIKEAQQKTAENTQRLEELRKELQSIESIKNEKEAIKRDAEDREKAALDKFKAEADAHKRAEEEQEMIKAQEEEKKLASEAFKELDINQDGILSYTEVQQFAKFDQNVDGVVDEDEAKFFLHMKDEMDLDEFSTTGWIIMKPYYMKDKMAESMSSEPTESSITPSVEIESPSPATENDEEEADEEANDEANDEALADEEGDAGEGEDSGPPYLPPKRHHEEPAPADTSLPDYDEETLAIIENSKKAKKEYSDVESKYLDLTNNIRELEVSLEMDYGPEREFLPLQGECFEYTDREYTYKLCPFGKATQRSKEGGGETNLGQWGSWTGGEENKYARMKYEGGTQCWNGPPRSVEVDLKCGLKNAILSASEPARCEYRFEFETPALCRTHSNGGSPHEHSEL